MKLTPKEQDRLTIFTLAELARRRRARGMKLNYPEAVALICDEVMEEAGAGRSYEEVVAHGIKVLAEEDVMEGVAELANKIYIEPLFNDGTKLVVLHRPIQKLGKKTQEKKSAPGSPLPDTITINAGKPTSSLTVTNTSDQPVQITSHTPFGEVNRGMQYDRAQTS